MLERSREAKQLHTSWPESNAVIKPAFVFKSQAYLASPTHGIIRNPMYFSVVIIEFQPACEQARQANMRANKQR